MTNIFKGLSDIWDPGQTLVSQFSVCSTITPPLHFDVIFPIGSYYHML